MLFLIQIVLEVQVGFFCQYSVDLPPEIPTEKKVCWNMGGGDSSY